MEMRKNCMKIRVAVLCVSVFTSLFIHCDARIPQGIRHERSSTIEVTKKLKSLRHLDFNDPSLDQYNANAPTSFPPFDDTVGSLSPSYLPQNTPPYCIYPPFTPSPPSTTVPTPMVYAQPPPPPPSFTIPAPPTFIPSPPEYAPAPPEFEPSPPEYVPGPPEYVPNPPEYVPSPPEYGPNPPEYVPSPPEYGPYPPEYVPSPPESFPSPPVFLPPVVFPPPSVPPPSYSGSGLPLWCVAKPTVPEPIIKEAMNYACGSGADCDSIQPNGSCYKPDTLILHASFAFNSFWQRTKAAGGSCDFGGTGMLITKDPSQIQFYSRSDRNSTHFYLVDNDEFIVRSNTHMWIGHAKAKL